MTKKRPRPSKLTTEDVRLAVVMRAQDAMGADREFSLWLAETRRNAVVTALQKAGFQYDTILCVVEGRPVVIGAKQGASSG